MRNLLPSRGRPGISLAMTVERELTADDIITLASGDPSLPRVAAPVIQKIKARHQRAARLVAEGRSHIEVALAVGYTPQRVSDLARNDPAFQELVHYYEDQIKEIHIADAVRVQGKLLDVAETALDEIQERLDDLAGLRATPIGELRQIAQLGLDRTVAPPKGGTGVGQNAPTHITLSFGRTLVERRETKDITPTSGDDEA